MSERPKEGDRYVVTNSFETVVVTHWSAPFTGGYVRVMPVGLEFVVDFDPPDIATGVSATPAPREAWEVVLVPEGDRMAEKYGGYSISVPFQHLAEDCRRL